MSLPRSILVADDDPDTRELVAALVKRTFPDAEVVTAPDGGSALRMAQERRQRAAPFDIVVTDHQMPKITGLELLRILEAEQDPARRFLISASPEAEEASRRESAIDAFLAKPFDPRALGTRLRDVAAMDARSHPEAVEEG